MSTLIIPYSVLTFILSLAITIFSLSKIIPRLKDLARQPIYSEGPKWHEVKSGTPTMGGIVFLFAFALSVILTLALNHGSDELSSIILLALFSVLNGGVGIFDDMMKLKHKQNKGISARQKILLQSVLAALFLLSRAVFFGDGTEVSIFNLTLDLGIFYYPFSMVLILGAINCANLTDGVDGLLSSVSLIISVTLTVLCVATSSPYSILCASLVGMTLGFLFFNIYPAKIFMGDTGSLFLGAFIISTLYSIKMPAAFLSVGAVFVIEGVSVILQVAVYKASGRRLFLMSPLHHHLERRGFSETQICVMAIIVTLIASLPILIYEVL